MKTLNSIIFALFFTFLFSCNSEKNNESEQGKKDSLEQTSLLKSEIVPAFENLNIEYTKHEMASNEHFEIKSETGSEVKIPENAFVDENGNPVTGKVEIQYREIISASEIIFSGVDMKYEKDGKQYDFQTAGMFDIRAFSNGKPVFLAKGKEIEVSFASNISGDYGFYSYDEKAGNWVETDYGKVEISEEEPQTEMAFQMPKPVQIDPKNDLIIEVKANYKRFPELAQYKGIMWKYVGEKDKAEITALLSKIWSNSELKPLEPSKNIYTLSMITGKKAYDLEVMPVFSPAQYKKALAVYEEKKKVAELKKSKEYNVKRKTNISELGLYNYDAIHSSDRMIVQSDFKVKTQDQLLPVEDVNLFLIMGDDNVVIRYPHNKLTSMYISPSASNKLVAIMPGNKVAVLDSKNFEKAINEIQNKNILQYSFVLNMVKTEITKPSDLDEVIAKL
jgi:hypothetical protein